MSNEAEISMRAVSRREALLGGASIALVAALPADAALNYKNIQDPSGFAKKYFVEAPSLVPGDIEIFGVRLNYLDLTRKIVDQYNEFVAFVRQFEEPSNAPVTFGQEIPRTGSSVLNGILAAITQVNPVAGVTATIIDMDRQLVDINRKLDDISRKIDKIYDIIARLREDINEDAVRRDIAKLRAVLTTQIQNYRIEKENFARRVGEAAALADTRTKSAQTLAGARNLRKSAQSRAERRKADDEIAAAETNLQQVTTQLGEKTAEVAAYAKDHYEPRLNDLAVSIHDAASNLMNYTKDTADAPTGTVAVSIAHAVSMVRAIHAELGRDERDLQPVLQLYRNWRDHAKNVDVRRSIASVSAIFVSHRDAHLKMAGETCVGRFAQLQRNTYELAYAVIRRRGANLADTFHLGAYFWIDVSPAEDGSGRLRVDLGQRPVDSLTDHRKYAAEYANKTCQGDDIDTIFAKDLKEAHKLYDRLVKKPMARSKLKPSLESFYYWRAHALAAQDSATEVSYLKGVGDLLDSSIDGGRA